MPVKVTFDTLDKSLKQESSLLKEWTETAFLPPSSHSDRAVSLPFSDDSIIGKFISSIPEWFSKMIEKDNVSWDDAVCPSILIPNGLSSITKTDYVKVLSRKVFKLTESSRIFNSDRIAKFPKRLVTAELTVRQHLLYCLIQP